MSKDQYAESPAITWNKDYLLRWEDFKGNPNHKIPASANSSVGLESQPTIQLITTKTKFKFKINVVGIRAIFIPDASMMIKERISEQGSATLLRHEQGHFDLAEEIARKSNVKLNAEFNSRTFTIHGNNEEESKKNALHQVKEMISKYLVEEHEELKTLEKKYDEETRHGIIEDKQNVYNERFDKLRI
ncbi:MAG: hypothetical protein D4R72_02285 [Nitrosopumilales archaeon]|nr:MAG: hypothetical protein D4R72_02285 [Nitrosopumilales archaeon]